MAHVKTTQTEHLIQGEGGEMHTRGAVKKYRGRTTFYLGKEKKGGK